MASLELNVRNDVSLKEHSDEKEDVGNFKKPLILPRPISKGKSSILHKYLQQKKLSKTNEIKEEESIVDVKNVEIPLPIKSEEIKPKSDVDLQSKIADVQCTYKEPSWSGVAEKKYSLEELKSGVIQRNIDLTSKSYFIFGRLDSCDISMAHPTISRYHAALQYRGVEEEDKDCGFYLYDLGSTHGTFLNKNRLKPKIFVRVKVGHVLKLGCSTRMFVLQGPSEDEEAESDLTVTELKEKRKLELEERERKAEEQRQLLELEEERRQKALEERGIDWGMGEDADEETDLSENPFAVTTNEELYIDDPKKTLRGWFEREGEELAYEVEQAEKGMFCCKIVLPIDNGAGKDVVVEATGKSKKEATVQCALEACRQIDKQGLLRQSHHESRKRQTKNWEENDYYDSDEDNFLDRTGQIEKKREKRMRKMGKIQDTVETYESLMEKHRDVIAKITRAEQKMNNLKSSSLNKLDNSDGGDLDVLDAFMKKLDQKCPSKLEIKMCQVEILNLRKEEEKLRQMVNIAKPASLPELKPMTIEKKPVTNAEGESDIHPKPDNSTEPMKVEPLAATNEEEPSEDFTEEPKNNRVLGPQLPKSEDLQFTEEKKKKRSRQRLKQKPQKEPELPVGFEDDYNNCIWTPPENQTGDGRTSLNDKLGY